MLVIGSGPIVIGQAAEFDYAGTEACLALKEEDIEVVLLNNNPATIMTDETIADSIYMEPMTLETVEEIFKKEQLDGMIGTLGGQTGLNLTFKACQSGLLEKYQVKLLGSSIDSIQNGEDREKFRGLMNEIQEPVPESYVITTMEEALIHAVDIGYPLMIRPAYTLGGAGGGFAENEQELKKIIANGLNVSPIHQVLLEKSIKGYKEIEFEVIRDVNNDCVIVCSMENFDPVGVHTGDSIVVAPAQTLTESQEAMLKESAVRIVRELGVIGACNIQFALHAKTDQYYVIEVNPRVSRSSALASKATGCPIAMIATKCSMLDSLDQYFPDKKNPVYELEMDYTVVKIPRFSFDKFPEADRKLGTQMKATGETMAIDMTFTAALNKAVRSLDSGCTSLSHPMISGKNFNMLLEHLLLPTDLRLFALAEAIRQGKTITELASLTAITPYFLECVENIVMLEDQMKQETMETVSKNQLQKAKQMQMSDTALASFLGGTEEEIRNQLKKFEFKPKYLSIGSIQQSPYYFSTWGEDGQAAHAIQKKKQSILIIGSGPIRIGQGMEFDYSAVQAVYALKKFGYETIVVNNNPETVSTDSSVADRLYFEGLCTEDILAVADAEQAEGVMIQFGGQTAVKLAEKLKEAGVHIYGTSPEKIDQLEDRKQFYHLLDQFAIPHVQGEMAYNLGELKWNAQKIGYPVLVRPSYVIGGESMQIIYHEEMLTEYMKHLVHVKDSFWPILIDQYTPELEVELDLISDGENIIVPTIMEHVEKAGVHSGDSIAVMPSLSLSQNQKETMIHYAAIICQQANAVGLVNIQYIVTDECIYVLEVNPRASRTIPLISKVTGYPMVEEAIRVQLGEKLVQTGLMKQVDFYAVKAPVFSAAQLTGVDPVLEPVMKSTGETIGIGKTYQDALYKATHIPANILIQGKTKNGIICSVTDREKQGMLELIQHLSEKFFIMATAGTSEFLTQNGVANQLIDSDPDSFQALFQQQEIAGVIVIPSSLPVKKHGKELRKLAILYQKPLFTNQQTLAAALDCSVHSPDAVLSLQDYHYTTVY